MRATQMGLTVAIPARDVPQDREGARAYFRDAVEQATMIHLRRAAGGVPPLSPIAVKVDGPADDPIQGTIYALTVAASFDADSLPADCEFYMAYNGGAGGVVQPDQGPLIAGTGDAP